MAPTTETLNIKLKKTMITFTNKRAVANLKWLAKAINPKHHSQALHYIYSDGKQYLVTTDGHRLHSLDFDGTDHVGEIPEGSYKVVSVTAKEVIIVQDHLAQKFPPAWVQVIPKSHNLTEIEKTYVDRKGKTQERQYSFETTPCEIALLVKQAYNCTYLHDAFGFGTLAPKAHNQKWQLAVEDGSGILQITQEDKLAIVMPVRLD